MSIWRGIQSAIFYYVSCTPILDARYKKRRQKEARRDALNRHEWKTAHPDYPDQVAPNSTNPFWQSEIEAGPQIDSTKLDEIKEKRKRRSGESQRKLKTSATQSTIGSNAQSSTNTSSSAYTGHGGAGDRWNYRVYQRQDEELWGVGMSQIPSNISLGRASTRPSTARTGISAAAKSYHADSNPAINSMHPPTTRKIVRPEAVAWMFQPLPTAEVMSGKEPPSRSRTNSDLSRSTQPYPMKRPSLAPIEVSRDSDATDAMDDTAVQTPESHVLPRPSPADFAYEHTYREVSKRRSLEW